MLSICSNGVTGTAGLSFFRGRQKEISGLLTKKPFWMVHQHFSPALCQGAVFFPHTHKTASRECGYICRVGKLLVGYVELNPSVDFVTQAESKMCKDLGKPLSSRVTGQREMSFTVPDEIVVGDG